MDILDIILGIVILVGCGYLWGYLQKQQDEYDRGYFFGKVDGAKEEQKLKNKVTLYEGIVPSEILDLDDVYCISDQGGLPEGETSIAVHFKDGRCYFCDSVSFSKKVDDL